MSEETVPQQGGTGQPKGLLQQMEELMSALNADLSALDADLSALDADLQAAGDADRRPSEEEQVG
jgi:outer membrane murein-binding lipoprotein Lpp